MNEAILKDLQKLLRKYSEQDLKLAIKELSNNKDERELTVIVNSGMHATPANLHKGDVFFFSEGNVDLDPSRIKETVNKLSRRTVSFLRSKTWSKVYIVPSGHPLLVAMATLITYRVTRVNPTVIYYLNGEYSEVDLDVRAEALDSYHL